MAPDGSLQAPVPKKSPIAIARKLVAFASVISFGQHRFSRLLVYGTLRTCTDWLASCGVMLLVEEGKLDISAPAFRALVATQYCVRFACGGHRAPYFAALNSPLGT